MKQTDACEALARMVLASSHPRLEPYVMISVGGAQKHFICTRQGPKILIQFSWAALRSGNVEYIVGEAAQSAEQLLFAKSQASRIALDPLDYWIHAQHQLPCSE